MCPFCCVSFWLFLLVVFVFFWLVSLFLVLLRHSFLSLDFCLSSSSFFSSSFVLFFFFSFALHVFFLFFVLSSVFPFLTFLSVTRHYLLFLFPFVLCFHFVSRFIFLLFCVFSPFSSSFSRFVFFLPKPPRAFEKEHQ